MAILVQSNKKPSVSYPSQTGAIVNFNSQYAGLPLKSHKIALTATQSGSGTPSLENPRSISGWSKIRIGQLGNSPLNSYFEGLYNGTYGFVDLGSLEYSMLSVPQGTLFRGVLTSIKRTTGSGILPNIICPIYRTTTQTDRTEESISQPTESGNVDIIDSSYTSVSDFKTAMSGIYLIYELATPTTPTITEAEFNTLLTAFGVSGIMFTIQIGSRVYGGEYDARTGVLTITHGFIASYNGETINEPWISSMDEYVEGTTPTNGAQVVYPLSVPQTVQLPPCAIDTLEGVNNIWADTGETTVQYIKIGG